MARQQTVYITETDSSQKIIIGRAETYGTQQVIFDFSQMVQKLGQPQQIKLYIAFGGSLRELTLPVVGTTAIWNITADDTASKGVGECEVYYLLESGGLWKSDIFQVTVKRDINS